MLKNDNHYDIVSQNTSENKYLFEVKNHPKYLCNKPTENYPTTYDSMYVSIHYGGFDMKTGRKLNELGSLLLQYQNNAFFSKPGNLYVYSPQPKRADPYINKRLNMDYELQQGTKLDYLFFESSRALQASGINLLKNQCEQERNQTFTILMLSLENPRLAGYMLTGNWSMFLETDGSLAWLYSYPQVRSPLHILNQCYDKIPILYKGQIQFVDPITRQTLPDALPQNCSDPIKNLFHSKWIWIKKTHGTPWHPKLPTETDLQCSPPKTYLPSLRKNSLNQPKQECIQKDNSVNFGMLS